MDRGVLSDPLRMASTVCLVKDDPDLKVLMVRRPLTARFMPGVWVFPGGAVDEADAAPPPVFTTSSVDPWRVAAMREIAEETGIWITERGTEEHGVSETALDDVTAAGAILDADRLIYFANWITPRIFPIRFDTRFFLAVVDQHTEATVDGEELVDLAWVGASEALERESAGAWDIAFPTRETLKLLSAERSTSAIVETLQGLGTVPAVEPRLWVSETEARILLPDDEGFDEAGPAQEDPEILDRLQEVVSLGGTLPAEFRSRG